MTTTRSLVLATAMACLVACGDGTGGGDASTSGMDAGVPDANVTADAGGVDTGPPMCAEIDGACSVRSDCCFGLVCASGQCICFRAGDTSPCGTTLPDGSFAHAFCCSRHATPVPGSESNCACALSQVGDRCRSDVDCEGGRCIDGRCAESEACPPGFADCDGDSADGCETDLATVTDCGACGTVCSLPTAPHTVAACDAGTCSATCEDGWGDCNSDPGDGCETELTTGANCGGCGMTCGSASCEAGACCLGNGRGCGFGLETPCCPGLYCNGTYCTRTSCARAGAACIAGTQCCSDTCQEGRCCGRTGGACASDTDCCYEGQTCNEGRCCVALGAPCTESLACCTGYCAGGRCT